MRPVTLSVAAAVEALEGAALVGAGLFVGVEAVAGRPHDLPSAIALSVFALLVGAGLLLVGRGLWRVRRWGRAPALLTQVFVVIAAVSMFQAGRYLPGTALILVAAVGVAALFSPPTTHALMED